PGVRTTMSASSVRTSMIFPLPSSPHWAPTSIVFAIFETHPCRLRMFHSNKKPRSSFGVNTRSIYRRKLGNCGKPVNEDHRLIGTTDFTNLHGSEFVLVNLPQSQRLCFSAPMR